MGKCLICKKELRAGSVFFNYKQTSNGYHKICLSRDSIKKMKKMGTYKRK